MKTPEELNALKEEIEALNKKLNELTGEELAQVAGGDGTETGTCREVCYNPRCEYYGRLVGVSAGPPAPQEGQIYLVCNSCGEIITTKNGKPIPYRAY